MSKMWDTLDKAAPLSYLYVLTLNTAAATDLRQSSQKCKGSELSNFLEPGLSLPGVKRRALY